jgi:hypothetical protein
MDTCYLCGLPIEPGTGNVDHIPAPQFFPSELRRTLDWRLVTRPTHIACNQKHGRDEDYFGATMTPFAADTVAGRAMVEDTIRRNDEGHALGLTGKVLGEFDHRPSGLYIPDKYVVKRINSQRVDRIMWKIVRGFYFVEHEVVLPEQTPYDTKVVPPNYPIPRRYDAVLASPSRGAYEDISTTGITFTRMGTWPSTSGPCVSGKSC